MKKNKYTIKSKHHQIIIQMDKHPTGMQGLQYQEQGHQSQLLQN